jgi:general secretion pathway protein A
MYSLTPEFETYAACGICLMLFGLFILSMRSRKASAKSRYTLYPPSTSASRRPAPGGPSSLALRTAPVPALRPMRITNKGLGFAERAKAIASLQKRLADAALAPVISPVAPPPVVLQANPAPIPVVKIEPVVIADVLAADPSTALIPASGISATEFSVPAELLHDVPIPAVIPATMDILSPEEIGERIAQIVEFSKLPPIAEENNLELPFDGPFAEAEKSAVKEVRIEPQATREPASSEITEGTDVLSFYGMPQQPFDVTPDPAFLYRSESHSEALASLKSGIEHFRGFMVLIAEPGMGKTTVLHKLMEELADSSRVVFLFQTQCTSRELLCFILNELEVDHSGMDVVAMHRALNQALLEEMLRGRRFVLIVDEAQNLQEPVLETIRLLSDFETSHSKLIQIVLAGQPQLAETLMRPKLVQLRQRIAVLSNLKSLTPIETSAYIEHRLRSAGWTDKLIFSSAALDQIAESSQGVPRTINNLCFNALLEAYHRGLDFVEADIVLDVSDKLNVEALLRPLRAGGAPFVETAATADAIGASELERALTNALREDVQTEVNFARNNGFRTKPEVILKGNIKEKVRSHDWSKRHEYRVQVTLERDFAAGAAVSERYYSCSIYMDEPQAAGLEPGRPVRIKIQQD